MSLEQKLLDYIRQEFGREDESEITTDTKLISSGIIDSFSLVSLQGFIEREFGKKIPAAWITVESFDSVAQMAEVIRD
ncbi:MAG: acyl carrier protein [Candidatus Cloacimonadaceae bacterium]|nr:acyl carrier protein [Candidatus Cloacimonadaceae bacterium]